MDLLVLGGTHHVGRNVVEAALSEGHRVTTLSRGSSGPPPPGAVALHADRTRPGELAEALGSRQFDAVVDTWSTAPRAVLEAAELLADRVGHYGYVSTVSVYREPTPAGIGEDFPVVEGDPGAETLDYAADKRGAEMAVLGHLGARALVARAGLILGPHERVGRLPWWLRRLERGGPVAAPGPADRPLQYIDGRDLAGWLLASAGAGTGGIFNAVGRPGSTTMGRLLEAAREVTGSRAELVWATPEAVEAAGISPWTEFPIWVPPGEEYAGVHDIDVTAAHRAGLSCRTVGRRSPTPGRRCWRRGTRRASGPDRSGARPRRSSACWRLSGTADGDRAAPGAP